MSVWFAVPSKRPDGGTVAMWRHKGYLTAVFRDDGDPPVPDVDLQIAGPYPGYARAVNALTAEILRRDARAEWIVTGGDDVEPDVLGPRVIAAQCTDHFAGTFGVMQPTGDRWGERNGSAYADRICGSPWMGREFCRRIYGGNGQLWPEFTHMFVDEHLQGVALKLGILWQRRDLVHFHRHWGRIRGRVEDRPAFLESVNSKEHWFQSKKILDRLRSAGFCEAENLLP